MKRILICLLCGLLLASVPVAYAADSNDTEALLDSVLSACLAEVGADDVQEWIDGDLTDGAGSRGEWYIIGLSQSGLDCDFSRYRKALEKYVEGHEIRSAASRQRVALTFLAIGGGEDYIAAVMDNSMGDMGLMSEVFGLHLINNGVTHPIHNAESVIDTIVSMELPGGGWAIRGDVPETDTTAMVLQALAPHRETRPVAEVIERALVVLSESQLPDGSYQSYGVANPESGAQIMTALCALGIHPLEDSRFIKEGNTLLDGILLFQLPDGSFSHDLGGERNPTATLQVFYNLVALHRYEQGLTAFHHMDGPGETAKGMELPTDYRFWVAAAAGMLGLGYCLVLVIQGRKNPKNYLFVLILAMAVAVGIQFIQLEKPENYYGQAEQLGEDTITTTIAIRCDKVAGQRDYIPADGVVLPATAIELNRGATAVEQLVAAARTHNIHLENEGGVSDYISGMAYLYEYDFGDLSGWVFCVNGEVSAVGCGEYELQPGDHVEWIYSLEMGADIQ